MSLISEALKAAQRERTERAGPQARAALAEGFFPYLETRKGRRAGLVVALGIGAVALIATAGTLAHFRGRGKVTPRSTASVAHVVTPPVTVPTDAPPADARPTDARPTAPVTPPPAASHAAAETGHIAPPTPGASRTGLAATKSTSARDSKNAKVAADSAHRRGASMTGATNAPAATVPVTAAPAATATSAAPPVAPRGAASSDGRVVVDPLGVRAGDTLFARAYAEHRRGNLDLAQDLYEQAIRTGQVSADLYTDYAALLTERKNYAAAVPMLQLALQSDSKNVNAWINLGDVYDDLGQHADAIAAFGSAQQLNSAAPGVMVRLAKEYVAIGDTSGARKKFDEAVRTAPNDAAARYSYGSFLVTQHDVAGAIKQFEQFLNVAPGQYPDATVQAVRAYVANLRKGAT